MIEHLFDLMIPPGGRNKIGDSRVRGAVGTDFRTLRSRAVVVARLIGMIALASLLILVLLPAVLAVQAKGT